jgi:hypothetical protein
MLLTSSMLSWTLLWAGPSFFSARVTNHLDLASMALTPLFVPGLLANDMDRTSPLRVVMGCGLAAAFVVPTTWWIQSLVEGGTLALPWIALALSTFVIIFWKSARQLYRHYRPIAEVVDAIEEEDDLDFSSDPVEAEVEVPAVAVVVELAPVLVPTFEEEFEPEFDLEPAAAVAVPPGDIAPPPTPEELLTWPYVERRKANRPWSNRPAATVQAKVPDDLSAIDWAAYVPNVYSIDSTGWSVKGNQRWQDLHPDAWEDADRWLAEALTPQDRDSRVA